VDERRLSLLIAVDVGSTVGPHHQQGQQNQHNAGASFGASRGNQGQSPSEDARRPPPAIG